MGGGWEIHFRKAASRDDDIVMRDYIPPQLHARYMAIAGKASECRASDKKLKTQLRWGEKDIKILSKKKVSDEPLRKIDLNEFMKDTELPDYDSNVKWKARPENKYKRNLVFRNKESVRPSMRKNLEQQQKEGPAGLIRQHSNTSETRSSKKQKKDGTSQSSPDSSDMDDYETFS